jgi:hypothetical protein
MAGKRKNPATKCQGCKRSLPSGCCELLGIVDQTALRECRIRGLRDQRWDFDVDRIKLPHYPPEE